RWRSFLVLGLLNNAIPFTLIFMGETEIGAGLASILNATTPLWTVLATHATTTNEKLNGAKLAGCALGLAGTILLIGPGALADVGGKVWAELAVIAASASYASGFAFGRRFSSLPAPVTATGQLTASTLLMLPTALIIDQPWHLPMPPASAMAAVLGLAWLSTAFAYILYFRIIQRAGATNTSLVTFIVPPSAILLGVVFLGEHLRGGEFAAMVFIAAGLLCIDGRLQTAWKGLVRMRSNAR
ncbi:MAG TPA: DMT family transporter, partial [Pararhizobium sp.]|nr:DMT family transporter [Pararhizobium sp.]